MSMIATQKRKRRGWSEGSIYQRADGRWVGSVSLGYDGQGKRKRRVVYGETKNDVAKELRKLQTSADAGAVAESGRLTLGEFVNHWLENTARPKVRPATFHRYEQIARLHVVAQLGGVQLGKLRAAHVEGFYAAMQKSGASGRTRQSCGQLLSAALKHAVRVKLIPFSPAEAVPKAQPEHRELVTLTEQQTGQLLAEAKEHRLHALFAVAIGTGMRLGELLALQWADIDLEGGEITVRRSLNEIGGRFSVGEPKSAASKRTISLPAFALAALKGHRVAMLAEGNIGGPVFCTRTANYISKPSLTKQVYQPMLKRAGLPLFRFHDLRHAHASHLLSQGHSLKAVSQRLGHARVELTLRVYAHAMPSDDAKLAEGLNRLYG
jgi:integrase